MLFDLQVEFKTLTIHFKGSKEDNLLWNQISSNLGLVDDLTISSVPNIDFTPVFTSWPQKITIMNSAWFTLESLLTSPCTTITLGNSELENKDLDEIFRKWRAGELPNLKYLRILSPSFTDNGDHVLGRNLRELDGMVIQTDDGSNKATIRLSFRWKIEMNVTPL